MPSAKQVAVQKLAEERRAIALSLRARGATVTAIAKQMSLDKSTVSRYITEALRDISKEEKETLQLLQRKTLLDLRIALWPAAKRGDVPSVNSIRGLLEHEAKILGLYAPTQQQHTVTAGGGADFADTTARLLAVIAGEPDPTEQEPAE